MARDNYVYVADDETGLLYLVKALAIVADETGSCGSATGNTGTVEIIMKCTKHLQTGIVSMLFPLILTACGSSSNTVNTVIGNQLSIASATVTEGSGVDSNLQFVISLDQAASTNISVDYASSDGSASAGEDYTAVSGTVTFVAGETVKTIALAVLSDTTLEADETVLLTLSSANGASIASAVGVGVIIDDEVPSLQLDADIKTLNFSWPSVAGADFYRLSENPDGASGYTVITGASNLTTTSFSKAVAVHQHNWPNASYLLEACNSTRCASSIEISSTDLVLRAIGYVKASNTDSGDSFGYTVSVSDDGTTLAVGAWGENSNATGINGDDRNDTVGNSGAVYVYTQGVQGWQFEAYIKADILSAGDQFGYSVSLSADGSTLAVGANKEDSNYTGISVATPGVEDSASAAGAIYIFVRNSGTWAQQAFIKSSATNPAGGDELGFSVSLSGDGNTLAAGMPLEDGSATSVGGTVNIAAVDAGAVYIFTRTGTSWSEEEYIKPFNTRSTEQFGKVVALSSDGNLLATASDQEKSNGTGVNGGGEADSSLPQAGAAYLFRRNTGVWSQEAYIKASNTEESDRFGKSMALSRDGTTLAVGAYYEDGGLAGPRVSDAAAEADNSSSESGAAYVFSYSGSAWSQQAYIKASNPGVNDQLGRGIALSGDGNQLAVGAYREDSEAYGVNQNQNSEGKVDAGAVYVFTRSTATWTQSAYLKAPNSGVGDLFGTSVSLSNDGKVMAVGAEEERAKSAGIYTGDHASAGDDSTSGSGAVYLF